MARTDRYGAARKKKKRNALFAPLSFLLVCVALVFGMGVFFRVQIIEVQGAEQYTVEEVIEASGISEGDNLFFINESAVSSRLFSRLPLVEKASADPSLPNKIVITIQESTSLGYVDWQGISWMLTGNCKLLGTPTQPEDLEGLIRVINVTPVDPNAGEIMEVAPEDSLKLAYLQELLSSMENLNMCGDVTVVDMENVSNPAFRYLDRFTVRMGSNDNTDYKLRMLISAVSTQLDSDESGTIDLSDSATVRVIPD